MTSRDSRFTLVLLGLAAYRLTRAVTEDSISDPVRTRALVRYGDGPTSVGRLVNCPWCAGWWISGVVVVCAVVSGLLPRRAATVAWWPAVAGAQGLLQSLESKLTESEH